MSDAADEFRDERPSATRAVASLPRPASIALGVSIPALIGALAAFARYVPELRFVACGALFVAAVLLLGPQLLAQTPKRFTKALPADGLLGLAMGPVLLALWFIPSAVVVVVFAVHAVSVIGGAVLRPRELLRMLPLSLAGVAATLLATSTQPFGWVLAQILFGAGFAMLGRSLLYGAVRAVARREQARVDAELLRYWDDARLFRVVGRADAPERRLMAATESVRDALYRLSRMGAESLDADNVYIYFLEPDEQHLVLREQYSRGEPQNGLPRASAQSGALSLPVKRRRAVRLAGNGVSEHRHGAIGAFPSVPLVDGGLVAGAVVFDRQRARPFEPSDEKKAQALADEVSRAVETERIISVLDEERREKTRVFTAARAFGGVVREEEAAVVALSTSLKIAPLDAAAFLRVCPDESLELLHVDGERKDALFTDESITCDPETWVGRAIRQGTLLPHVCVKHAGAQRGVYARGDKRARHFKDLRVIPLFAQGERVGALVVAARKKLTRSHIDSLGVIADLAGVAFAGAGHYTELERLATTDGLTKLLNRRSLDGKLEEALGRAKRNDTPLAVILSDIDHFKSVNDTYGHQVGDDVLVEVAATFAECVRTTDVVARYGGEEFCLVLENTDKDGAVQLAERIRTSIASLKFNTELGPLEVTSSFGVAMFKGDDGSALVSEADSALYVAKERGRNRVILG